MEMSFYSRQQNKYLPLSHVRNAKGVLEHMGLHSPPVDVASVAGHFRIAVQRVIVTPWHVVMDMGRAGPEKTRTQTLPAIVLSAACPAEQRSLRLAHALGHYVLHHDKRQIFCHCFNENAAASYYEAEADRFALALVMPEQWVRAYAKYDHPAQRFGVDAGIMTMRQEMLGIKP